jgi:hypothetical protein
MADPEEGAKKRPKRTKTEKELARNREYQKDYYEKNKEAIKAYKREKYHEDQEYQRKGRVRAKRRYWIAERQENREPPKFMPLERVRSKGALPLRVDNPADARHGELLMVPVYTTKAVGELLGQKAETIRLWFKRGQFPEPYFRTENAGARLVPGRNPRLFTVDEMRVMDRHKEKLVLPSHGRQHDLFVQAVEEEFRHMVQGLTPLPK